VGYSDRGEGIDIYAPADGTLSANKSYTNEGPRPDTYPGFSYNGGVAYDTAFSGTSAACPVTAGFLATVIEHNRDWSWRELKEWIQTLDVQDAGDFYYGTESTTATSANWTDYRSLEGGEARVAYQGVFNARFRSGKRPVVGGNLQVRGNLNFRLRK
jgi:subtilisin family serine protease